MFAVRLDIFVMETKYGNHVCVTYTRIWVPILTSDRRTCVTAAAFSIYSIMMMMMMMILAVATIT